MHILWSGDHVSIKVRNVRTWSAVRLLARNQFEICVEYQATERDQEVFGSEWNRIVFQDNWRYIFHGSLRDNF